MADNPFLLPPGSAPTPRSEPAVAPVVAPAAPLAAPASGPAPAGYIAVPASVESVTHRIARPQTAPVAVQEPKPDDPDNPDDPDKPDDPDVEETRLAAPPKPDVTPAAETADRALSLVLPDGTRVPVEGPILLGRDPAALAERPGAQLLALLDSAKTVSKTHALVEPTGLPEGGLRIRDLYSTNGVAINAGEVRTVLAPGGEGAAPRGAVVELGSFTVMVDARTQQQ